MHWSELARGGFSLYGRTGHEHDEDIPVILLLNASFLLTTYSLGPSPEMPAQSLWKYQQIRADAEMSDLYKEEERLPRSRIRHMMRNVVVEVR